MSGEDALRAAAQAIVDHLDGLGPRHGLWTTLKADREAIRAALATPSERPADGRTWEQMYARHRAVAKVIHDRAGDEDPHAFGRETASCDWLADQVLAATPSERPADVLSDEAMQRALHAANAILDVPYAYPDADAAIVARSFLRVVSYSPGVRATPADPERRRVTVETLVAAIIAAGPPPDAQMDGTPAGQALRSWWLDRYAPVLTAARLAATDPEETR